MRLLPFIFFGLVFFCAFLFGATLSVSPPHFEYKQSGGKSISSKITIYNSSHKAMRVKLYVGDFWYDKQNKRSFPHPGSTSFSGASWLVLPQKKATVPAKGNIEVPFVVAIPPKPKPSSYATIFVERETSIKKKQDEGSVGVSLRIAIPVLYQRPGTSISNIKVKRFSVKKPSRFRPLKLKFDLVNPNDTYLFPQGNLLIVRGAKKQFVAKEQIKKERIILPKQSLQYELGVPIDMKPGKYEGLLTLFYGEKKHIVKNFAFSLP